MFRTPVSLLSITWHNVSHPVSLLSITWHNVSYPCVASFYNVGVLTGLKEMIIMDESTKIGMAC